MTEETSTKVFISYSWDSDHHKESVLALANTLRTKYGIDADIDRYVRATSPYTPEKGWDLWMQDRIQWAEFVLIVCTETYRRRFKGQEMPGKGLGVSWEGTIIRNDLYLNQLRDTKFIPVVLSSSDLPYVPLVLNAKDKYICDDINSFEDLLYRLKKQPRIIKSEIGTKDLPLPSDPLLFSPQRPPLSHTRTSLNQVFEDELGIQEKISQAISDNANLNPQGFLLGLGESAYRITRKQYDVMVFNLGVPFTDNLRNIKFKAILDYNSSIQYIIWVFKGGEFINKGDDTLKNWVFKGSIEAQRKDEREDKIVWFISSSWNCLCQNGKKLGSVDIWWGDREEDGTWACNEWISSCNRECTAQRL